MKKIEPANPTPFQHCNSCPTKSTCLERNQCRRNWRRTELMSYGFVDFVGMKCEEASILSRDTFIPCGQPVWGVVYHERDQRPYMMCFGCAEHNVANRGAILIARSYVKGGR